MTNPVPAADEPQTLERLAALGRLTGGVAHDFNHLLTILLSHAERLRHAEGQERAELVQGLEVAARQAADLAARLVALARSAHAPLRRDRHAVDLAGTIAEVTALLRRTGNPRVSLQVQVTPGLMPVWAEPTAVTQVLLNLCLNAYDALPEGGTLVVEAEPAEGAFVRLAVQDSGAGIPPEAQARIFDPAFSTKNGGRHAGLGLVIVADVVRRQGGRIEYHPAPGRGARFEVFLPTVGSSQPQTAGPPPAESPPRTTVLVVENDSLVQRLAQTVLAQEGYRVLTATDGRQAVETYRNRSTPIDLVLMDLNMPVLSGLEAAEELRRIDPAVHIVLTSGAPPEALPARFGFLSKPYRPAELLAALAAALGRKPETPKSEPPTGGKQ
jgi:CheY-like chemotaxis protein/two-component sensor histidine kinase